MKRTSQPGSLIHVGADAAVVQALGMPATPHVQSPATPSPPRELAAQVPGTPSQALSVHNAQRLSQAVSPAASVAAEAAAATDAATVRAGADGSVPVGSPQRQAVASMHSRLFEKQRKASQVSAVQLELQLAALASAAKPDQGKAQQARRK